MKRFSILVLILVSGYFCNSIKWTHLEVTGDLPLPRSQHTAVLKTSTNEMIIFGGLHMYNSLDDTYSFNIDKSEWRKLATSGNPPPRLRKHTAVLSDDETKMIVFGGGDDNGGLYNTIWSLDLVTLVWSVENTLGTKPVARVGHTAVKIHGNKMVIFAGNSDRAMLNDLFLYDITLKKWTNLSPKGYIPVARTAPSGLLLDDNNIYVFGGIKYYGDLYGYLDTIDRYSIANNAWEKVDVQNPINPRASFGFSKTARGNFLVVHGYWTLYHDDTTYYDPKSNTWEYVDSSDSHELPLGRSHPTTVSVVKGDTTKVLLFAGNDGIMVPDLGSKNDIWVGVGTGF